jgi:hypothetical protein
MHGLGAQAAQEAHGPGRASGGQPQMKTYCAKHKRAGNARQRARDQTLLTSQ